MTSNRTRVTGNSAAPALPASGQNPRAHLYGLLLAGTMTGLPIPAFIQLDADGITLSFDKDDRAAVDAWAAFFGLKPATENDSCGRRIYSSDGYGFPDPTPWRSVRCNIAPIDAERAEVTR